MLTAGEGLEAGEGVGARETGSDTWAHVTSSRTFRDTDRRVEPGERAVDASREKVKPETPDVRMSLSAQKLVLG